MQTYRAYLLDLRGKIVWGDWIEAANEEEARVKAHELCSKGQPVVELWQGAKMLGELDCASPA